MRKISPSFVRLLKLCIHLESEHNSFYRNKEGIEWNTIVDIAFSIDEILSNHAEEIPIKALISARRLASYIININTSNLFKEDQAYNFLDTSPIGIKIDNNVREVEDAYFDEERISIINELRFSFPKGIFTDDVTQIINLTYEEVLLDFENGCHISAISICGKIIETVLSYLYEKVFNKSADEEKLGIDAIINRLKKSKSYEFKGTIKEQLNIIKLHRNKAVHGSIIIPTVDESRAVISLTRDILQKACSKEN